MSDAPKMMFSEELQQSFAAGAELMAAMVRQSVFGDMVMPPPEIFEWYVLHTAYRFVAAEFAVVYKLEGYSVEAMQAAEEELKGVRLVIGKAQQFGLQSKVDDVLRIREMHLPGRPM